MLGSLFYLSQVGSCSELIMGWAAWVGIWEVRGQFLPLLPTLWATVGQSLPPHPRTHTGLCFLTSK